MAPFFWPLAWPAFAAGPARFAPCPPASKTDTFPLPASPFAQNQQHNTNNDGGDHDSGGPGASTHVEVLGNDEVLGDLLRIVSGAADAAAAAAATGGSGGGSKGGKGRGKAGEEKGGGQEDEDGEGDGGGGEAVGDRYVTAIREIAAAIDWGA